jgi:ribonucleoside-diphosphate reductase alpha chain
MTASGEGTSKDAERVAAAVEEELRRTCETTGEDCQPAVEHIQDVVERTLILLKLPATAKAYILYRHERAEQRAVVGDVPSHVRELAEESSQYFRNSLAEFVYYRSYSRWIDAEGRRETWIETVDRYIDFMRENLGDKLKPAEYKQLRQAILEMRVMPSMRLMWSAGVACRKTNVCAYNCSFIAPTKIEDLAEIMYLSMCGTGVGFSVESLTAQQFPIIKRQMGRRWKTYVIDDSKEGWCDAFVAGAQAWFSGYDVEFDFSKLREAGARLYTMGGKSSGPEPLRELLKFTREKVLSRQGKRLRNIDLHDIICKIGEIVVSGGVRRTALISLSDLDDQEMRHAKEGAFYMTEPQRSLANNSAIYTEKPTGTDFLEEWIALMKSGTGERGIFNRGSLGNQLPERRWKVFKKHLDGCGTNPCGEIILRSKQFCNLTEVVARVEDDEKELLAKVRLATILGTYQSTLTSFPYLSREWKKNCEEERLLGVSITGQWDCPAVRDPKVLSKMRDEAVKVNKEFAKRFGVNQSTAVTCVKPSGTVSQLVDSASGMHPRHAAYYIRRIRISATDSLFKMMKDQGVPYHPEVGQSPENANTFVLEFPVKAPDGSRFKDGQPTLEQLDYWKTVKENYTEHNPSVTVSVGEEEWIETAHWLYKNWEIIGGLSFLPRTKHVYKLAPYEEITKAEYEELVSKMPNVDFSKIVFYERNDETQGAKELACVGGVCEIDFNDTKNATDETKKGKGD